MSGPWFSTCTICGGKLGPHALPPEQRCTGGPGHEVPSTHSIDYPDQQTTFTPTNAQQRARQRRAKNRPAGSREAPSVTSAPRAGGETGQGSEMEGSLPGAAPDLLADLLKSVRITGKVR